MVPLTVPDLFDTYLPARHKWFRGDAELFYFGLHVPQFPEQLDGAERIAGYFNTTTRVASTHLTTDSDSGVRCAPDNYRCASMVGANQKGIHVEMTGYAGQTAAEWMDPFSVATMQRTAGINRLYIEEYDFEPVILSQAEMRTGVRKGSIKHSDAVDVWGGDGRSDPGPNFPDDYYVSLLRGEEEMTYPMSDWDKSYNAATKDTPSGVVQLVQKWLHLKGLYHKTHGKKTDAMGRAIQEYKRTVLGHANPTTRIGNPLWEIILGDMYPTDNSTCQSDLAQANTKLNQIHQISAGD